MTSRIPFIILCLLCLFAASPLSAATYLVENVARIKGQESTTISGWGIVSGLPGTGDDPKSYTPMAEAILKTLELGGMHIEPGRDRHRSVSSVRNSALVKVSVRIPATGAREGTMLDCTITSEGNAKSLKGGYLSTCFLKGPIPQPMEIAEPLGMADGQIRIEDAATPTVGKIKKGCRLLADFNNPYIEKGTMTLVIHPQFARGSLMARSLAQSINGFFEELGEGPRAKAVGLNYVMVRFPSSEFADPVQYVDQIMQIQVLLDREMVPTVDRKSVV